jgi:hypothetical protein
VQRITVGKSTQLLIRDQHGFEPKDSALQCRVIVPNSSPRRASGGVLQCRAIVPNSSARRASGGVLRVSAVWPTGSRSLIAPIDWGQSIYQQCRAIVPNSSARRASGGVLRFPAVWPTGHGHLLRRSLGDNRSTNSVELLSPIAPPDAQAAAAFGSRLFGPRVTVTYCADRLGTIDLPTV